MASKFWGGGGVCQETPLVLEFLRYPVNICDKFSRLTVKTKIGCDHLCSWLLKDKKTSAANRKSGPYVSQQITLAS